MSNEDEILKEAHDYSAALDRREERKEIYMALIPEWAEQTLSEKSMEILHNRAELIYQGMIRFCDENKKTIP